MGRWYVTHFTCILCGKFCMPHHFGAQGLAHDDCMAESEREAHESDPEGEME